MDIYLAANSRKDTWILGGDFFFGFFFDVFRRDIKHLKRRKEKEKKLSSKAIGEGNAAAHDGDAVADTFLFECDKRTDRTLFSESYMALKQIRSYTIVRI